MCYSVFPWFVLCDKGIVLAFWGLGQIKKYLNLLVKPRFFSGFLEKNIILCILKGGMPFKIHIFFPEKN